MATSSGWNPFSLENRTQQAIQGGQDFLRWGHPNGSVLALNNQDNAANNFIVTGRLIDTTTIPVGTFYAGFPMNGMQSVSVHLLFTFTGGSITSSVYTTYRDFLTQYNAFSGTGALTSGTEQVSTYAAPVGEQYAIVKLIIATNPVVITSGQPIRAEYNGLRG